MSNITSVRAAAAVLGILLLAGCAGAVPAAQQTPTPGTSAGPTKPPEPMPTGSPVPKNQLQSKLATPVPQTSFTEETGAISTDEVITMDHFANSDFTATTAWRMECDDRFETIAAGSVGDAGYVITGSEDVVDGTNARVDKLQAPDGVGALTITAASCDAVTVQDSSGTTLTYQPATNAWKN